MTVRDYSNQYVKNGPTELLVYLERASVDKNGNFILGPVPNERRISVFDIWVFVLFSSFLHALCVLEHTLSRV